MLTVQRIFDRAAELIEEHGWSQHETGKAVGPMCLQAALWSAKAEYIQQGYLTPPFENLNAELYQRIGSDVLIWHAGWERTKDDVLAILRGENDALD